VHKTKKLVQGKYYLSREKTKNSIVKPEDASMAERPALVGKIKQVIATTTNITSVQGKII